ncbi:hypothetical protein LIER_42753 [Lithospermum erythrorhizon]|uniref:SWIM-type domain-containing protein n=1 Tax=Lithospermum erythrorhizon TaxID=34254 RepID=A0AAV3NW18_LITER
MEQSKTTRPVDMREPFLFADILGNVSRVALNLIRGEITRNEKQQIGVDESKCGCYYNRTHGIPCSHLIALSYSSGFGIPLSEFHDFWKKIDIEIDTTAVELVLLIATFKKRGMNSKTLHFYCNENYLSQLTKRYIQS